MIRVEVVRKVRFVGVIRSSYGLLGAAKDFVETVPAWVDLQRIAEHHKDDNGELTNSNEQAGSWIHGDDIRADLQTDRQQQ